MKKGLLLLYIALSFSGFSQTISCPANGVIYDFAVGDTFQYTGGTNNGGQWVYYNIIIDRSNYSNDSIVYTMKNIRSQNYNAPTVNTIYQKIVMLDSSFCSSSGGWTFDSVSVSTNTGDTVYITNTHSYVSLYCDFLGQYISGTPTAENHYSVGLGAIYSHSCSNTSPPCYYCNANRLIYVHKANGFIDGTPDNSLFTAIEQIRNPQSEFRIAPNPATTYLTIQSNQNISSPAVFQLYDITGRMILQKPLTQKENRIELSGVSKGMYLYNVISDKEKAGAGKLVVE